MANGQGHTGDETRRKEQIVLAARELFETKGLSRTNIKDITERVGVTRSLFYHYFSNMDDVTDAVLDQVVSEFVERIHRWNDERETGAVMQAVHSSVRMLRQGMEDAGSLRQGLAHDNAALYMRFSSQVADSLAQYLVETTASDYARLHPVKVDNLYETFFVLIAGLIDLLRAHPETDDACLANIVVQSLHLDVNADSRVA